MNLEHKIKILIEGKNLLGKGLEEATKDLGDFGSALKKLSAISKGLGERLSKVFNGLLSLVKKLVIGIGALTVAFLGSGAAAARYASRLEAAERTFRAIQGEAAPGMLQALRANTAYMLSDLQLQDQYNKAYMLTGKLLADRLPEAYEYMAKVAIATNDDVDFLTERLYRSVGRLSTRWMAYVGTVVSMEEAQLHAAKMFGKTTDELTRTEIQAAMLDRVLEKLNARTAEMPAILGTSEQMFRALKVSVENLWGAYGRHFLPVAREVIRSMLNINRAATSIISENGALYDTFRIWSAAGTVLAEAFGNLVAGFTKADSALFKRLKSFGERLTHFAWQAFQWGANISVRLAAGMIKGASIAITQAMNFITGMLTWWLKGHSPPRVAPDLVKWGAAAMEEWLKGFTLASFETLEQVQGKLESVLSAFVGMEWLTKSGAAKLFLDITKQMSKGLSRLDTLGGVLGDTFKRLAEVGGGFGEHLVKYAKLQLSVTKATERLAKAVRDLKAANIELEDSQTHLAKVSEEYQMMLMHGASYRELLAKRDEVRAAKVRKSKAKESITAAEKEKSLAEKQLELDRERLELQGRLLDQLVLLLQKQAELSEEAAKGVGAGARGGAAGGAGGLPAMLEPIVPELMSGIDLDQAFEDLKDRIRSKFEGLWAELAKIWEESEVGKVFTGLQTAFEELGTALDKASGPISDGLHKFADPLYQWLKDDILGWALGEVDKWKDWWEEEAPDLLAAIEILEPKTNSLISKIYTFGLAYLMIETNKLKLAISTSSSMLRFTLEVAALVIEGKFPEIGERLQRGLNKTIVQALEATLSDEQIEILKKDWLPKLETLFGVIETSFNKTKDIVLPGYRDNFLGSLQTETVGFQVDWGSIWTEITTELQNAMTFDLIPALEDLGEMVGITLPINLEALGTSWTVDVFPAITTSVLGLGTKIAEFGLDVKEWAEEKLPAALEMLRSKFKSKFDKISEALAPVKDLWDEFVLAIQNFAHWLSTKVFKFEFDWPTLPSWATPGSPLPIHTAWKNFYNDLQHMTFAPNLQLGTEPQLAYANAGTGQQHIYIERLVLENVQDAPDLLRQLQEIAL